MNNVNFTELVFKSFCYNNLSDHLLYMAPTIMKSEI